MINVNNGKGGKKLIVKKDALKGLLPFSQWIGLDIGYKGRNPRYIEVDSQKVEKACVVYHLFLLYFVLSSAFSFLTATYLIYKVLGNSYDGATISPEQPIVPEEMLENSYDGATISPEQPTVPREMLDSYYIPGTKILREGCPPDVGTYSKECPPDGV